MQSHQSLQTMLTHLAQRFRDMIGDRSQAERLHTHWPR